MGKVSLPSKITETQNLHLWPPGGKTDQGLKWEFRISPLKPVLILPQIYLQLYYWAFFAMVFCFLGSFGRHWPHSPGWKKKYPEDCQLPRFQHNVFSFIGKLLSHLRFKICIWKKRDCLFKSNDYLSFPLPSLWLHPFWFNSVRHSVMKSETYS